MLSGAKRSRNISELQITVRDSSTSLGMTKAVVSWVYGFISALNSSIASWMSGSSLNDSAGFAASAAAFDGMPSFATNLTDQSRPLASLRSVSSCRRLFTLASTSISDRSSGECPSKKLRPSIPIGRTDSLNVRKRPFAGIRSE